MKLRQNIVAQAIAGMPSPSQQQAYEVALLTVAGHGPTEIGRRLKLTWPKVEAIRSEVGEAVVDLLRGEGYSPGEIAATLGIPTPMSQWNGNATPSSSPSPGSRPPAIGAASPSSASGPQL